MRTVNFSDEDRSISRGASCTHTEGSAWMGGVAFLVTVSLLLSGCQSADTSDPVSVERSAEPQATPEAPSVPGVQAPDVPGPQAGMTLGPGEEVSLFDGQTLGKWKVTDFGGQGDVHIENGAVYLEMGSYMTGITWTGPVIRMNYEITLEAMRVQGNDFFCGLTFPVGDKPCSLILGGWGGSVCGLSNIDYYDAADNETTRIIGFKNDTWYRVRLRVVPDRIQAWLDDEELVNIETTGRKIDIRPEVDLSQPLGIATWVTTGAIRDIRLKKLPEDGQ